MKTKQRLQELAGLRPLSLLRENDSLGSENSSSQEFGKYVPQEGDEEVTISGVKMTWDTNRDSKRYDWIFANRYNILVKELPDENGKPSLNHEITGNKQNIINYLTSKDNMFGPYSIEQVEQEFPELA